MTMTTRSPKQFPEFRSAKIRCIRFALTALIGSLLCPTGEALSKPLVQEAGDQAASTEQPTRVDAFVKARTDFEAELNRLAEVCERIGLSTEAQITRSWLAPIRDDRSTLYLPENRSLTQASKADSKALASWKKHFTKARSHFAEAVFEVAEEVVQTDEAEAYRLLWQVLRNDAEHREAKRILGFLAKAPNASVRLVRGRSPLGELRWKAGDYSRIETPHFVVLSHADPRESRGIASQLEQYFALWTQLFFTHWSEPGTLRKRFNGKNRDWPRRDKLEVVLLKDRQEYLEILGARESNIAVSVGYYNPSARKSFYYPEQSLRDTLIHETTHQLLMESVEFETSANAGERGGIWLLEGIALYMESLQAHPAGYYTVGGVDSPRMQTARYRGVRDGFWPSWTSFTIGGISAWKSDPNLARLYTHASGISQVLLHKSESSRDAFVNQLVGVYSGRNESASLLDQLAPNEKAAKEAYVNELIVNEAELLQIVAAQQQGESPIRELVLCGSEFPEATWRKLQQLPSLEWLDVSFSNVSDQALEWLPKLEKLERLSLEGTAIGTPTLERVAKLSALKELDLSGCRISDTKLELIQANAQIETLWLAQTQISADALPLLKSMPNLKTVDVSDTQITEEAWTAFIEANPRFKSN